MKNIFSYKIVILIILIFCFTISFYLSGLVEVSVVPLGDDKAEAYVDALSGGIYIRGCTWTDYGTSWPSDALGTCTPPSCVSGDTSIGVDCYPTTHYSNVQTMGGLPQAFSAMGVCERVCEK